MKFKILAAVAVVMSLMFASNALASNQHSLYGQCGPAVHNGTQLVNTWGAMGVLNSPIASSITKSAGWKPMDGAMVSFLVQRGREFKLAQPANIEDFGCRYGSMYSVGNRHYGAGEWVIGIVPGQYNPSQISGHARKGYHRVLIWVHVVGRGNCANGFRGYELVIAYVPTSHPLPKPTAPKTTPAPTTPVSLQTVVCTIGGVPQYIQPQGYVINTQGQCVAQQQQQQTQTQVNNNTQTTTVVVTTPPPTPVCTDHSATNYGGSLPCIHPQPVQKPAPSCYINMVQELDESNSPAAPNTTSTTPVYLHCTAPSGDSLSITLHDGMGTLSTNSASQTGSGSDQVSTVTYTASTEAGTDTVTAHVVDNTTGETTDASVSIKIDAPVVSP